MKVLLVGFAKIAYMPYMHFYLDMMDSEDIELIYWDRDGKPDSEVPNKISKSYRFDHFIDEDAPFRSKLKIFYKYRKFVLNVLRHNVYDKIILLHTTQGLTIIDYLIFKQKKNYLLDFRDISHEGSRIYRKIVGLLAKRAGCVVVSSDAFRRFLPNNININTIHNYLNDSLLHRNCHAINLRAKPIKISFWGLVRQVSINEKLIDALGNDNRFELHYYGRMQTQGQLLEAYVKDNAYANVFFHGQYFPNQRYEFAANTDILHNIYNNGIVTGNATGNKYYDGIIFRLPQICTQGTFMGKLVSRHDVGLSLDLDSPNLADQIYEYYTTLDKEVFVKHCDETLDKVITEQRKTVSLVKDFLGLR